MEIHQNPSRYRDQSVSASISAQNAFTPPLSILGDFNFSLSGTWVGTVFIQRSFDGGTTWLDVTSYTANIQDTGFEPETRALYRAGIKTGGYTSGTAVMRISQ